jgi:uncharacterized protein YcbX
LTAVTVTRLSRYPVKACAGEDLTTAEVDEAGVRHDRLLAVVVGSQVVTQRELPQLARVQPVLDDATMRLTLSMPAPAGAADDTVSAVVRTEGRTMAVTLFGETVQVVDQPAELSEWLSAVLGRRARLVAAPRTSRRRSPGAVEGETLLSDEGTLSLHSEASLTLLNERLAERGHPALPADRFRANVVLGGCDAHREDAVDRFAIGPVLMRFAQLDERCAVTTVDQEAGVRAGPEPLRTLAGYRRAERGGVRFGIYTAVERGGRISVGDRVLLDGS